MKTLSIIGSTGSIGRSSLKVFEKNKKFFILDSLAANKNLKKILLQTKKYNPANFILLDKNIKTKNRKFISFENFIKNRIKKIDYVISGISGYDALQINLKLLKISKNLLIANKETIICGGKVFMDLAKKHKCKIIPIDSEHHCIDFFVNNFKNKKNIKKIFLTASGGPFLKKRINYFTKASRATKHPTWKMGKHISVNSSTLANKVLELFEAKILFNLNKNMLDIKIEETSNIHAIIQLKNNFCIQIAHRPSMQIPISNSLNVSNIQNFYNKNFTFNILNPDYKKFPIVKLGKSILNKYNHYLMIIFTVYNERLVNLYLKNKINYGDISKYLVKIFSQKFIIKKSKEKIKNSNDIFNAISFAKNLKI